MSITAEQFNDLMSPVYEQIKGKTVDKTLAADLNEAFPAGGDMFQAIEKACHEAIEAGWMCAHGDEGRRFGRVIEASEETHNLSVDVVDLKDFVGPHHKHPKGEICLTIPVTPTATFEHRGAGWVCFKPGSSHHPTVRDGQALVLYLLPDGEIEFTKS